MENILDKIKKLLRLSRSANEHEARLALQRAMELATRHGVDIETLRSDPEVGGIAHEWFPCQARLSREWKLALSVVQRFFHVHVCVDPPRRRLVLVGRVEAITVADYVLQFLVRRSRGELRGFCAAEAAARRRMTSGKRAGFIVGFFTAINVHLADALNAMTGREESWAMVLADEAAKRTQHLDAVVGKRTHVSTHSRRIRASGALHAGYAAGKATQLHNPLSGATSAPPLTQPNLMLEDAHE